MVMEVPRGGLDSSETLLPNAAAECSKKQAVQPRQVSFSISFAVTLLGNLHEQYMIRRAKA
jgi:hypothetical protein